MHNCDGRSSSLKSVHRIVLKWETRHSRYHLWKGLIFELTSEILFELLKCIRMVAIIKSWKYLQHTFFVYLSFVSLVFFLFTICMYSYILLFQSQRVSLATRQRPLLSAVSIFFMLGVLCLGLFAILLSFLWAVYCDGDFKMSSPPWALSPCYGGGAWPAGMPFPGRFNHAGLVPGKKPEKGLPLAFQVWRGANRPLRKGPCGAHDATRPKWVSTCCLNS